MCVEEERKTFLKCCQDKLRLVFSNPQRQQEAMMQPSIYVTSVHQATALDAQNVKKKKAYSSVQKQIVKYT